MYQTFNQYPEVTINNFNYTNTIDAYLKSIGMINAQVHNINIHGTLTEENEIFGYGNDLNQEYQKLKDLEDY